MKKTTLTLTVVGMQYRVTMSSRRMMASDAEEGTIECRLEREPNNRYDENAIKVIIASEPFKGFHIGYLQRPVAVTLAPLMDAGDIHIVAAVLDSVNPQEGEGELEVMVKTAGKPRKKKSTGNP